MIACQVLRIAGQRVCEVDDLKSRSSTSKITFLLNGRISGFPFWLNWVEGGQTIRARSPRDI